LGNPAPAPVLKADPRRVIALAWPSDCVKGRSSKQTQRVRRAQEKTMGANAKWNFDADFIQACNCDYGCPCEFSAPPTRGNCEGMVAWKITKGKYDNTPLDGLGLAMAVSWPKAIHEGNGIACVYIDEKANAAQRDALLQIAAGKQGGLPFEIIVQTFSAIHGPRFVPMQFKMDGRNSSVKVGDAIQVRVEPIKNPVTGEAESVRVDHGTGFIFKSAECVSAAEMRVTAGEVNFSWPNKAAFVTRVQYGN
jgi:hypothetical protein